MKTTDEKIDFIYFVIKTFWITFWIWLIIGGLVAIVSLTSCAPIPVEYNDTYQQGALYEQVNDSTWIKL